MCWLSHGGGGGEWANRHPYQLLEKGKPTTLDTLFCSNIVQSCLINERMDLLIEYIAKNMCPTVLVNICPKVCKMPIRPTFCISSNFLQCSFDFLISILDDDARVVDIKFGLKT